MFGTHGNFIKPPSNPEEIRQLILDLNENDKRSNELEKQEKFIRNKVAQLTEKKAGLTERKAELNEQQAELDERKAEILRQFPELAERERKRVVNPSARPSQENTSSQGEKAQQAKKQDSSNGNRKPHFTHGGSEFSSEPLKIFGEIFGLNQDQDLAEYHDPEQINFSKLDGTPWVADTGPIIEYLKNHPRTKKCDLSKFTLVYEIEKIFSVIPETQLEQITVLVGMDNEQIKKLRDAVLKHKAKNNIDLEVILLKSETDDKFKSLMGNHARSKSDNASSKSDNSLKGKITGIFGHKKTKVSG